MRVEDLDRQRCKREYADQLMDDLLWLGLEWDEGPEKDLQTQKGANKNCAQAQEGGAQNGGNAQNGGRAGNEGAAPRSDKGPYFQSERDGVYQKYFSKLEARGLVYDCFCSRADLLASSAPHANDAPPVYAGTCRNLSPEERARLLTERKPAKRLRVDARQSTFIDGHYGEQKCDLARDCGDFILRRADGNFSYNLAVTVDDALMGVTQIARGRDLLASSHQQLFLYEALGFTPPQFFHFPLLVDKEGRRLSKRDKDLDMGVLRANNTPQKIIGKLMRLCGFTNRDYALELSDALEIFSWERLPKSDIVVD